MAFSEVTKLKVLIRAGYRCECTRRDLLHIGRCPVAITRATAEFNHLHADRLGGGDSPSNCEALCQKCHRLTASYGRH
jgi:5-methylcytosine-specific restriction endonuclease McrA